MAWDQRPICKMRGKSLQEGSFEENTVGKNIEEDYKVQVQQVIHTRAWKSWVRDFLVSNMWGGEFDMSPSMREGNMINKKVLKKILIVSFETDAAYIPLYNGKNDTKQCD